MNLQTERLVLKEINESHTEDILKIRSNAAINRFLTRNPPTTNYEALQFILTIRERTKNGQTMYFGILYEDQPGLIGTLCFLNFSEDRKTAEIGYELLPAYHRKGIMSEVLDIVLPYGFDDLKLHEILAVTHTLNEPSKALLLKHHFALKQNKKEEEFPEHLVFSLKNMQAHF